MAFIRKKIIGGKSYFYYVQNYRVGKATHQKVLKYLGNVVPKKTDLSKEFTEKKIQQAIRSELKFQPKFTTISILEDMKKLRSKFYSNLNSMSPATRRQFITRFRTGYTYHSCAIEGNTLNMAQVSLVINENTPIEGKPLYEIDEVRNHDAAIDYMLKENKDITEDFIKKVQGIVVAGMGRYFGNPNNVPPEKYDPNFVEGDYRIDQRYIQGTDFIPPKPKDVPKAIKNLILFYNRNKYLLHPIELAGVFHQRFEKIHPFCDGNGRVGRLLMNFILDRSGYPMIDISIKNRSRYIQSVAAKEPAKLILFLYEEFQNYIKELVKE